ncbi:hypothetical protein J5839_06165, partial [Methanosarcinaceae archaeon]|nr:hypothetical protein [Methanosarcinaceae archaeon]
FAVFTVCDVLHSVLLSESVASEESRDRKRISDPLRNRAAAFFPYSAIRNTGVFFERFPFFVGIVTHEFFRSVANTYTPIGINTKIA